MRGVSGWTSVRGKYPHGHIALVSAIRDGPPGAQPRRQRPFTSGLYALQPSGNKGPTGMSRASTAIAGLGGMIVGAEILTYLTGRTRPAIEGLSALNPPRDLPPARVVRLPAAARLSAIAHVQDQR